MICNADLERNPVESDGDKNLDLEHGSGMDAER